MADMVHIIAAPLVPLTEPEIARLINGEMRRRAFDRACHEWQLANPGRAAWFINDDAFCELREQN
jgi:hypothetical protein